jgi:protein transport protein SEC20
MLSTQLLSSQTATLRQTSNAHGQLSSLLDTSKNLVTALEKTDWLDRLLILGALIVFLLTCAWIIKVRVFDRMIRLTFWWVKWLPSWKSDQVLDELERGARILTSSTQRVVSTTISTIVTTTESVTSHITTAATTGTTPSSITHTTSEDLLSFLDEIPAAMTSLADVTQSIESLTTAAATRVASVLRDEL